MAAALKAADDIVVGEIAPEISEVFENVHTLDLGDKVFSCQPSVLPFGTLLKYAEQDLDLRAMHHLVVKLIHPDQLEAVWDAMDEVGLDKSQAAIIKAMESYTERPTK